MLVGAHLDENRVSASQMYRKLVKGTEKIFEHLLLSSKDQQKKQMIYLVSNICTQCSMARATMFIFCILPVATIRILEAWPCLNITSIKDTLNQTLPFLLPLQLMLVFALLWAAKRNQWLAWWWETILYLLICESMQIDKRENICVDQGKWKRMKMNLP